MLAQNKNTDNLYAFVEAAKAPLEHLFNNHIYCGDWCSVKRAERLGKTYVNTLGYLSKNNKKLRKTGTYAQLKAITDKYGSAF